MEECIPEKSHIHVISVEGSLRVRVIATSIKRYILVKSRLHAVFVTNHSNIIQAVKFTKGYTLGKSCIHVVLVGCSLSR